MLGILDDMAFHYMVDLGVAGPDKGKGGKYLVLPPGYKGDVPEGYFVVPSKTSGVWVFMRGYLDKSHAAGEGRSGRVEKHSQHAEGLSAVNRGCSTGDRVHQRIRQGHAHDPSERLQLL